jgi:hypothetical protein
MCSLSLRRAGGLWKSAVLLAAIEYGCGSSSSVCGLDSERALSLLQRGIEHYGLHGVWDMSPLLSGEDLKAVLPRLPNGPGFRHVRELKETMLRWLCTYDGVTL